MKYRKKPVVIEAVQYKVIREVPCKYGIHKDYNDGEIAEFMNCMLHSHAIENGDMVLDIHTLEGTMIASVGDYIIKGINGEFYPCKPDIFEKTYEKVEE